VQQEGLEPDWTISCAGPGSTTDKEEQTGSRYDMEVDKQTGGKGKKDLTALVVHLDN
jgi:hypothetical protein